MVGTVMGGWARLWEAEAFFWCFPPTPDLGSCWSKCLSFNSFHPTCVEVGHQTGHVLGTGAQRWRRQAPALLGHCWYRSCSTEFQGAAQGCGAEKGEVKQLVAIFHCHCSRTVPLFHWGSMQNFLWDKRGSILLQRKENPSFIGTCA